MNVTEFSSFPYEKIQPSKSLYFKCFRILNGWISDPHYIAIRLLYDANWLLFTICITDQFVTEGIWLLAQLPETTVTRLLLVGSLKGCYHLVTWMEHNKSGNWIV